jgi:hypothetical protein
MSKIVLPLIVRIGPGRYGFEVMKQNLSNRSAAWGGQSNQYALNIVVIHEDAATYWEARGIVKEIQSQMRLMADVEQSFWDFTMLTVPDLQRIALAEAAQAHLIIVAAESGDSLPSHVKLWLGMWCGQNQSEPAALLALIRDNDDSLGVYCPIPQYLKQVAELNQTEFFWPYQQPFTQSWVHRSELTLAV